MALPLAASLSASAVRDALAEFLDHLLAAAAAATSQRSQDALVASATSPVPSPPLSSSRHDATIDSRSLQEQQQQQQQQQQRLDDTTDAHQDHTRVRNESRRARVSVDDLVRGLESLESLDDRFDDYALVSVLRRAVAEVAAAELRTHGADPLGDLSPGHPDRGTPRV
jgi:hypothetical protein